MGWQILALKNREPTESINLNKETEGSCSNRSENSSEIKLDISRTPAIDSPLSSHPTTSRSLFPTSMRPSTVVTTQLFHNSTRPDLQCQKMDHTVKEESLCNMFGIDDQAGFWPWLEQQHFNWSEQCYLILGLIDHFNQNAAKCMGLAEIWKDHHHHHHHVTEIRNRDHHIAWFYKFLFSVLGVKR